MDSNVAGLPIGLALQGFLLRKLPEGAVGSGVGSALRALPDLDPLDHTTLTALTSDVDDPGNHGQNTL